MDLNLSEIEVDALKEMMNIGFGRAAGELSDILSLQVHLDIPEIEVLEPNGLSGYISKSTNAEDNYSIIRQFFIGKFKGFSLLALPLVQSKSFFACFCDEDEFDADVDSAVLERETLLEIGNIISGACVGEIAAILKDRVKFAPPEAFMYKGAEIIEPALSDEHRVILSFKTKFKLEDDEVYGFLFLVTTHETIVWLKQAIAEFLKQFE